MANKAECGGIEPPRTFSARKPVLKTGRATRPTHSEFCSCLILIHRLAVAAGQNPAVADAAGDACGVGVLEPGLGVLTAGLQAIPEAGECDLTLLLARGLYLLQDCFCRVG